MPHGREVGELGFKLQSSPWGCNVRVRTPPRAVLVSLSFVEEEAKSSDAPQQEKTE